MRPDLLERTSYCHTCKRAFNFMGIVVHMQSHKRGKKDCVITYKCGTFEHNFNKKEDLDAKN